MVTGGGHDTTLGSATTAKRRRKREQMHEEDSSDLSDESDEDGDQRAAQQIKFAKMPVRLRSGSSPIRAGQDATRPGRPRRGSQSAIEAVKARARRDTVTSSEMSSENEYDLNRPPMPSTKPLPKLPRPPASKRTSDPTVGVKRQQSDLLEEELEDDSDVSDMSSAFAESVESASMMDSVDGKLQISSPVDQVVGAVPRDIARTSPKKSRAVPHIMQALPTSPRPISTIQPKSLLSAAIQAKRTKASTPFESFASLSGQGDPNPLVLRILAPFTKSSKKSYEVLIRRTVHGGESGDRPVTVAELIGLSLWRYAEEKLEPIVAPEKLNVNWWTLRMVEDDEVDYDFPPLDRTKQVAAFATINNRAQRSRSGSEPYDEFALVEATPEQFQENQAATPQFKQETASDSSEDDQSLRGVPPTPALPPPPPRGNPLLTTMTSLRTPLDLPAAPVSQALPQRGVHKLLRVNIHSSDVTPGQMVTVDVSTDTYLAEVLDIVCKKRHLDKANHVLKLPGSGTVVFLDRTVGSIGNRAELDLFRRRFATDGPLTMTGSPGSTSPRSVLMSDSAAVRKIKRGVTSHSTHPLAQEALSNIKADELGSANYKKYIVWRKQPMRFVGMNERVIAIDGEYLHIMPSGTGKTMFEGQGKTTTVHFSNVVGCKVTRRHPTNFKVCDFSLFPSQRVRRMRFDGDADLKISWWSIGPMRRSGMISRRRVSMRRRRLCMRSRRELRRTTRLDLPRTHILLPPPMIIA
jgi:hypothetical protein